MNAVTLDKIIAVVPAAPVSLDRLEQVVTVAEKRARRARSKLSDARAENIAAMIDLCHAKAARTAFIAAQTDDQMRMF
ncbi:hypothetical protein LH128_00165 [Sphingomonas sp. LH128]|uniref:hypothetical protein n=1 Tax=Sphingomonas sp. LH128 TaxID=473781 RepID=UPI00027CB14C|nr:hypothetical protein [Sphingomonas sp. LH128]EJU15150.1 hypothetical protein LH128_00165 [Sphingomonas sp. LH128]